MKTTIYDWIFEIVTRQHDLSCIHVVYFTWLKAFFTRQLFPPLAPQLAMAAPPTFEQLLDQSGIPATHQMAKYLKHIGVIHKSQFALMFKDADALAVWCNKFKTKITFGDQEIEVTDEDIHSAMTGALTATYIQCKDEHDNQRMINLPTAPAAAAITHPTTTGATAVDDKVPKTWPPGEYQRLITQYHDNSGKTRHFPERTVLGADKILVRMWHEHHKSKNYTAVTLGEIITNRTFTALGTVDSTVKKDKLDQTPTIDTSNNTLVQQEQKDWDPQTSMMILDALDAIHGPGYSYNLEPRTKLPLTSNVSIIRHSHAGTPTDSQTSKPYGTPSLGR